MLHHIDTNQLPRALQDMLARGAGADDSASAAELPRRAFLKMLGVSGLALGAFPHLASAQAPAALKATEQPLAFVRIAADGIVTVTVNRLEFGRACRPRCR